MWLEVPPSITKDSCSHLARLIDHIEVHLKYDSFKPGMHVTVRSSSTEYGVGVVKASNVHDIDDGGGSVRYYRAGIHVEFKSATGEIFKRRFAPSDLQKVEES